MSIPDSTTNITCLPGELLSQFISDDGKEAAQQSRVSKAFNQAVSDKHNLPTSSFIEQNGLALVPCSFDD